MPSEKERRIADAARKAMKRQQRGHRQLARLSGLKLPGPAQLSLQRAWPEGSDGNGASASAGDGKVYDPDGILDAEGIGHEVFHLIDQQHLTEADRVRLQGALGKHATAGDWTQGETHQQLGKTSAQEVAADWFAALVTKRDPKHGWAGSYSDGGIPTRKELLRFGRAVERIGKRYGLKPYAQPVAQ